MISAGYLEHRYLELFAFTNLYMVPSLYFALYLKRFLSKSTIEKRVLNKKNPYYSRPHRSTINCSIKLISILGKV